MKMGPQSESWDSGWLSDAYVDQYVTGNRVTFGLPPGAPPECLDAFLDFFGENPYEVQRPEHKEGWVYSIWPPGLSIDACLGGRGVGFETQNARPKSPYIGDRSG